MVPKFSLKFSYFEVENFRIVRTNSGGEINQIVIVHQDEIDYILEKFGYQSLIYVNLKTSFIVKIT